MVDLRTEDVITRNITFFSNKSNNSFRYIPQDTATDVMYNDQNSNIKFLTSLGNNICRMKKYLPPLQGSNRPFEKMMLLPNFSRVVLISFTTKYKRSDL
jgi:hypothetical protein